MPNAPSPFGYYALPTIFRNGRIRIPTGFCPKAKGWEARPTLGTKFKKAFSTPKVLRQSSAIWAQPRWGCFEQGPKTQGRPAAVAVGQPWAGGRNPVGIRGNEAAPQIANLWVMHSFWEGTFHPADEGGVKGRNRGRVALFIICRPSPSPPTFNRNNDRHAIRHLLTKQKPDPKSNGRSQNGSLGFQVGNQIGHLLDGHRLFNSFRHQGQCARAEFSDLRSGNSVP